MRLEELGYRAGTRTAGPCTARGLVVATVTAIATACTSPGQQSGAVPSPEPAPWPVQDASAWDAECERAGLAGEGLALAGPDDANAYLFVGSICPFDLRQVPVVHRVSTATAGDGRLVMSHGADGYDRLAELIDGASRPVPGVPPDRKIFTPALNAQGDLAYVDTDDPLGDTLRVLRSGGEESEVSYRTEGHLAWPEWGPHGELVVTRETDTAQGSQSHLLVLQDGQEPVVHPSPFVSIVGLSWSADGPIAFSSVPLSDGRPPAIVMDPVTGEVINRLPAGWFVHDFTPDGDTLLIGRDDEVAYLTGPTFSEFRQLPDSPLGSTFSFSYER